jgi:hypothetical protein
MQASSILIKNVQPHASVKLQFGAEHSSDPYSINAHETAKIDGETQLGIEVPRSSDHRNILLHKIGTYLTVVIKALAKTVEPPHGQDGSSTHLDFHVDAELKEPQGHVTITDTHQPGEFVLQTSWVGEPYAQFHTQYPLAPTNEHFPKLLYVTPSQHASQSYSHLNFPQPRKEILLASVSPEGLDHIHEYNQHIAGSEHFEPSLHKNTGINLLDVVIPSVNGLQFGTEDTDETTDGGVLCGTGKVESANGGVLSGIGNIVSSIVGGILPGLIGSGNSGVEPVIGNTDGQVGGEIVPGNGNIIAQSAGGLLTGTARPTDSGLQLGVGNILQLDLSLPSSQLSPTFNNPILYPLSALSADQGVATNVPTKSAGLGNGGLISGNINILRTVNDDTSPETGNIVGPVTGVRLLGTDNTIGQIVGGLLGGIGNIQGPDEGGVLPGVGNIGGPDYGGLLPEAGNILQLDLSLPASQLNPAIYNSIPYAPSSLPIGKGTGTYTRTNSAGPENDSNLPETVNYVGPVTDHKLPGTESIIGQVVGGSLPGIGNVQRPGEKGLLSGVVNIDGPEHGGLLSGTGNILHVDLSLPTSQFNPPFYNTIPNPPSLSPVDQGTGSYIPTNGGGQNYGGLLPEIGNILQLDLSLPASQLNPTTYNTIPYPRIPSPTDQVIGTHIPTNSAGPQNGSNLPETGNNVRPVTGERLPGTENIIGQVVGGLLPGIGNVQPPGESGVLSGVVNIGGPELGGLLSGTGNILHVDLSLPVSQFNTEFYNPYPYPQSLFPIAQGTETHIPTNNAGPQNGSNLPETGNNVRQVTDDRLPGTENIIGQVVGGLLPGIGNVQRPGESGILSGVVNIGGPELGGLLSGTGNILHVDLSLPTSQFNPPFYNTIPNPPSLSPIDQGTGSYIPTNGAGPVTGVILPRTEDIKGQVGSLLSETGNHQRPAEGGVLQEDGNTGRPESGGLFSGTGNILQLDLSLLGSQFSPTSYPSNSLPTNKDIGRHITNSVGPENDGNLSKTRNSVGPVTTDRLTAAENIIGSATGGVLSGIRNVQKPGESGLLPGVGNIIGSGNGGSVTGNGNILQIDLSLPASHHPVYYNPISYPSSAFPTAIGINIPSNNAGPQNGCSLPETGNTVGPAYSDNLRKSGNVVGKVGSAKLTGTENAI